MLCHVLLQVTASHSRENLLIIYASTFKRLSNHSFHHESLWFTHPT